MSYFLGIDGGGSTIRAALVDENHALIEHVKINENVNPTSRGFESAVQQFQALQNRLSQYSSEIKSVFVSLAGAATVQQIAFLQERLSFLFDGANQIKILPDAYGALIANLKEEAGMLIICGTGSVVVGKEKGFFFDFGNKNFYRAGGWGYLLGDEGSGFWVVKKVFQEYLKYADGIGTYDPCFEVFEKRLSKIPREAIVSFYDPAKRHEVASLSKELLSRDNILIWDIVRDGAWEFYKKVRSLNKRIESPVTKLVYMGGMFESEKYRNLFINFNENDFTLEKGAEKLETELANIAADYLV